MSDSNTTAGMIELTIDGAAVRVPEGTTVFDAARMQGIAIPTLCHLQNETPVGVCRLCVVDTGATSADGVVRAAGRAGSESDNEFREGACGAEDIAWN